jgi:hypothetical protein
VSAVNRVNTAARYSRGKGCKRRDCSSVSVCLAFAGTQLDGQTQRYSPYAELAFSGGGRYWQARTPPWYRVHMERNANRVTPTSTFFIWIERDEPVLPHAPNRVEESHD